MYNCFVCGPNCARPHKTSHCGNFLEKPVSQKLHECVTANESFKTIKEKVESFGAKNCKLLAIYVGGLSVLSKEHHVMIILSDLYEFEMDGYPQGYTTYLEEFVKKLSYTQNRLGMKRGDVWNRTFSHTRLVIPPTILGIFTLEWFNDLLESAKEEEAYHLATQASLAEEQASKWKKTLWLSLKINDKSSTLEENVCGNEQQCSICFEDIPGKNMVGLNCSHTLCGDCAPQLITKSCNCCPMCRTTITEFNIHGKDTLIKIQNEKLEVFKKIIDDM